MIIMLQTNSQPCDLYCHIVAYNLENKPTICYLNLVALYWWSFIEFVLFKVFVLKEDLIKYSIQKDQTKQNSGFNKSKIGYIIIKLYIY